MTSASELVDVGLTAASTVGWLATGAHSMRLRQRLRTDALTGLGNRAALGRAFERTRSRPGRCVGVLMLDLNGFKQINDTFGHRVGDQVLVEVARRLRAQARAGQVPVRLSGDEFAVWLGSFRDDCAQWLAVEADIRRLSLVIGLPMRIEGHRLVVTASIGAGIKPAKPARLDGLLEPADRAMYRGKKPRRAAQHIA